MVGSDKLELDFVLVLPAEKKKSEKGIIDNSEFCCTHSLILYAYLPAVRNVIPEGQNLIIVQVHYYIFTVSRIRSRSNMITPKCAESASATG